MIPGEKPEGTVFEPSNTVPLGPWSMYKNVLAEYNLKQRWFLIDFLSYISYIIFSDQIAETWEACDRGRVPRPLSFFFIWNILQRGTYEQTVYYIYRTSWKTEKWKKSSYYRWWFCGRIPAEYQLLCINWWI